MVQRITDLIQESSPQIVTEEIEEIKELLNTRTPITWISDILIEELWSEGDFQGGDVPPPPSFSTIWQQLTRFLGHSQPVRGQTIREWRLSLTSDSPRSGSCCTPNIPKCTPCFRPRCGSRGCDRFSESCKPCQMTPILEHPDPALERAGGKRKAHTTTTSVNMHTMGIHFIEKVTAVDYTSLRNHIEVGQVSLTAPRFQATIRG